MTNQAATRENGRMVTFYTSASDTTYRHLGTAQDAADVEVYGRAIARFDPDRAEAVVVYAIVPGGKPEVCSVHRSILDEDGEAVAPASLYL